MQLTWPQGIQLGRLLTEPEEQKAITLAFLPKTTAVILPKAQTTPATITPATEDRKITTSAREIVTNPPSEENSATHATYAPQDATSQPLADLATMIAEAMAAAAAHLNTTTLKKRP